MVNNKVHGEPPWYLKGGQLMLMRKVTVLAALGLVMALSLPATAGHLGSLNRGGQDPQGDNRASDRAHERSRGQVNDIDNAAEDAGRGNGSDHVGSDADPGASGDTFTGDGRPGGGKNQGDD